MMNLLLAVDGSKCSGRATDYAIFLASRLADAPRVHLLHVHPPIPIGRVQAHIGQETLLSYYREESQIVMTDARTRLETAGVDFVSHIHVGPPGEIIARQAAELSCELILLGNQGYSEVASLAMGSVAARVLHLAACPVLLVK